MLKLIRRQVNKEDTYKLIEQLRKEIPGIHLRTTLMVGHPRETEEDFEELKEFIRKARFDRMEAFTCSEEEDTYAAQQYEGSIPQEVRQARPDELMDIQQGISAESSATKIGQQMKVIVDRIEGNYYIRHTEFDSPGVDPEVLISVSREEPEVEQLYQVKVTDVDGFDLYVKVLNKYE